MITAIKIFFSKNYSKKFKKKVCSFKYKIYNLFAQNTHSEKYEIELMDNLRKKSKIYRRESDIL